MRRSPTSRSSTPVAPRACSGSAAPYLTGHELDDSGGGWRDGLAAHVALQIGYLADRGHTRIALALPDREHPAGRGAAALRRPGGQHARPGAAGPGHAARVAGLRHRMAVPGPPSGIPRAQPGVTAVAAFDDDVALRILAALRDLGLRAPGDLAVIGYDDTGTAR